MRAVSKPETTPYEHQSVGDTVYDLPSKWNTVSQITRLITSTAWVVSMFLTWRSKDQNFKLFPTDGRNGLFFQRNIHLVLMPVMLINSLLHIGHSAHIHHQVCQLNDDKPEQAYLQTSLFHLAKPLLAIVGLACYCAYALGVPGGFVDEQEDMINRLAITVMSCYAVLHTCEARWSYMAMNEKHEESHIPFFNKHRNNHTLMVIGQVGLASSMLLLGAYYGMLNFMGRSVQESSIALGVVGDAAAIIGFGFQVANILFATYMMTSLCASNKDYMPLETSALEAGLLEEGGAEQLRENRSVSSP